jgi:O-succinylbenzoic acid--CoA ligase
VDWQSSETEVLLNPSLPTDDQQLIKKNLLSFDLKGHVWVGTSGSESEVKWVALSKNAILASAQAVNTHLQSTKHDIWVTALPDFHVGGLGILARSYLNGTSIVDYKLLHAKWNAAAFFQLAETFQATLTALVPAQIYDLVTHGYQVPKSLRAVIVGGGALEESLYHKAVAMGWKLLPSYGLTECASQVATAELDVLYSNDTFPEMRILPHLHVTTNAHGLIQVQGASLLTGYAQNTPKGFLFVDPKKEGTFLTEDRGQCTDNYLKILGRAGSFIKIGGESVSMSRLEKIFEEGRVQFGGNADMTLVAVPDPRLGHVIHLASTLPEEVVRQVITCYHSQVLPFERIRSVHVLENIPRTPLNKLCKIDLLKAIVDEKD